MANNTTHRPATIQRIRIGADARRHASPRSATRAGRATCRAASRRRRSTQTRLLYAGANRMTAMRLADARPARGQRHARAGRGAGPDGARDRHGRDGREARAWTRSSSAIVNDTQVDPEKPERPFSQRQLVECLRIGAERFGWTARNAAARARCATAAGWSAWAWRPAFRNNLVMKSGARVRLDARRHRHGRDRHDRHRHRQLHHHRPDGGRDDGRAARPGRRCGWATPTFPVSAGSGGQWGANSSTAGVYAACVKLREAVAQKLGFNSADVVFADGEVRAGNRSVPLAEAARRRRASWPRTRSSIGDLDKKHQQSTFGAHFVEVGVDAATGEIRVRRMLAVCAAGRILNPKIGAQPGDRRDDHGRRRGADGGARGRQAARLLRQPRPRRLRGAGACRHPAPGGDLPRRDRPDRPRR